MTRAIVPSDGPPSAVAALQRSWRPRRPRLPARPAPRLLHVFPNFDIGGAQVRFAALAEALGDRFAHTVVSLKGSYQASALLADPSMVRFEPPPSAAPFPAQIKAYRAKLAELRPDALLTYNWGAIEFALANLLGPTPHVHLEDGFGPEEAARRLRRRSWTRRLALARSEVVVPSRNLQGIATEEWGLAMRRVHYIPNGIAVRTGVSTPIEALGLDLPAALPRIVWAGALRPEKNPLRMVRAFAPLKDRAVLLMVGDGPERPALEQEIARQGLGAQVRLLGSRTDTRDLIMQCHILALTSDTEQMPLVVLEAMDAGLALASSDVGDIRLMVARENRPFVVPPTEADLRGALEALLQDAGLRRTVGEANRARLRSVYRLETMVEAYRRLFEQVVARADGRQTLHG